MTEIAQRAGIIVETALRAAFVQHHKLGAAGMEAAARNQFGEAALVADVRAEEAVLDAIEASGLAASVISEEHGEVDLNPQAGGQRLLAVLDGIDGTSLYRREPETGLYGTMFALFENDDPIYADYLAGGIMLHATGQLLLAVRNQGVIRLNLRAPIVDKVRTSGAPLGEDSVLYVDDDTAATSEHSLYEYFQTNLHTFGEPLRAAGYTTQRTGASVNYYANVVMGRASVVGESTRKGNLEIAAAYPLVREAGGLMVAAGTDGWHDLGREKYRSFGQDTTIPILTMANQATLEQAQGMLKGSSQQ